MSNSLVQTVIDNYTTAVFGSYWLATMFFLILMLYAMSLKDVQYTTQIYVVLIALSVFANQYLGAPVQFVFAIILGIIVGTILARRIL